MRRKIYEVPGSAAAVARQTDCRRREVATARRTARSCGSATTKSSSRTPG